MFLLVLISIAIHLIDLTPLRTEEYFKGPCMHLISIRRPYGLEFDIALSEGYISCMVIIKC